MDNQNIDVEKTKALLKSLRIEHKYSVKQLAEIFYRTEQAIYQWENPNYTTLPSVEDFYTLSRLYGLSLENLLIVKKEEK